MFDKGTEKLNMDQILRELYNLIVGLGGRFKSIYFRMMSVQ